MADENSKQGILEALWESLKGIPRQDWLDAAALASSPIPIAGDVIGLGADVNRLVNDPEERTPLNYALTALGALPFVPPVAGILRRGGDESLMPWHQSSQEGLLNALESGRGELASPSLGISKDQIPQAFGEVSLIPRSGAFDPESYSSSLFNRDAYTPRMESLEGLSDSAEGRLLQRFGAQGDALKMQVDNSDFPSAPRRRARIWDSDAIPEGMSASQIESIRQSPSFRSFREFERSPQGASLLTSKEMLPDDYAAYELSKLEEAFSPEMLQRLDSITGVTDADDPLKSLYLLQALQQAQRNPSTKFEQYLLRDLDPLGGGGRTSREILERLNADEGLQKAIDEFGSLYRNMPSEYAELKVGGPTQISPENWAGAVISSDLPNSSLLEALQSRGIPVELLPQTGLASDRFRLADELQRRAGEARKSR